MSDPQVYIFRNGNTVMNPAHFGAAEDNLSKQAQARELLAEIYSAPIDSQTVIADLIAKDNENLTPYMFYEATKTGHVLVSKAIEDSGKLGLSRGPNLFDDSVAKYQRTRTDEVLALSNPGERTRGVRTWLAEFDDGDQLMFDAAVGGHKHIITELLEIGIPHTSHTELYLVPLHAACHNGHLDCAQILLASGLDVNVKDDAGGTPLMRAAVSGKTEIVRWLLANGADPQVRETRKGHWNALEYGAGRDLEVTKMLLEPCGWTPAALMAAASFGQLEAFHLIAQAAGFPEPKESIVDKKTWTELLSDQHREAILGAIEQGGSGGEVDILRFLLSFIPSEVVKDEKATALLNRSIQRAAGKNRHEATEMLINFLNENHPGNNPFSRPISDLLIDTAAANAIETARLLLDKYGADVNFLEKAQNMSPLHSAVRYNHPEMIDLLIQDYHADIHRAGGKHANGPTPLWYAVVGQFEQSTRTLLACGGPVEYIDSAVYISADRTYRAPVKLRADMDPGWDDQHSTERFLCLEYPDGWPGGVQIRRPDEELQDGRELRRMEDVGFVVV